MLTTCPVLFINGIIFTQLLGNELLLSPLYRTGTKCQERLSNLSKVTQLAGRAGFEPKLCGIQHLHQGIRWPLSSKFTIPPHSFILPLKNSIVLFGPLLQNIYFMELSHMAGKMIASEIS